MKIRDALMIAGLFFANSRDISPAVRHLDPIVSSGVYRIFDRQFNELEYGGELKIIPERIMRARLTGGLYGDIIRYASKKSGLDEKVVYAVIDVESKGNLYAQSHAGAKGLMQLMPRTARSLGVKDIFSPDENITAGSDYLAGLVEFYGDFSLGLAAYNYGPDSLEKVLGRHGSNWRKNLPKETKDFIIRVQGTLALYERHNLFN